MTQAVTVFGGTGFLGRRLIRRLREKGFTVRIASRHPQRSREVFGDGDPHVLPVTADIHDECAVASAVAGAYGAVNAVSLYVEHGSETFQSVHVEAAGRLARQATHAGLQRLVHVSGIGADAHSPSPYIRSRGEGEQAVRGGFPAATIVRPAVMFGPDDAFLNTILKLLRRLPAYPMFGQGRTRLQPAHVEDVAEAVARALQRSDMQAATIECGGPQIYSYEELLRTIARAAGITPRLIPMPFAAWHLLASIAELLPEPPVTRNQVELMETDSIVSPQTPGFADLGIAPQSVERTLEAQGCARARAAA
jgi:uncharacterized protein YbjT (DUF2867 family)